MSNDNVIAEETAIGQFAIVESFDDLLDRYVDPNERYYDDNEQWVALGASREKASDIAFKTQEEHSYIRDRCRELAITNPFAICGHENRISYLIGSGHVYSAIPKDADNELQQSVAELVQSALNRFIEVNRWTNKQAEIVLRLDRDGECFIRQFRGQDGILRIRFIEPGLIYTPQSRLQIQSETYGVITDPDDIETVLGYWVDGEEIPAAKIQHRKANVDSTVKRGLPLFWPVRKNLRRAETLLRNMSAVAEIQAAIAIVRKHKAGTSTTVQQFRSALASKVITQGGTTRYLQRFRPGLILDVWGNVDYEFPSAGIDAAKYVAILQAELRAIASRLVMPEFMLTSDASNANYASTMVAEGPAVKMFERLQWALIEDDLTLIRAAVDCESIMRGEIPQNWRDYVEIVATPPNLVSRDPVAEATANATLVNARIRSRRTASERIGDDPEIEERRLEKERAYDDPFADLSVATPMDTSAGAPEELQPAEAQPSVPSAPSVDVAATALNGAQIESLLNIVQQVIAGQLPKESAKAIIVASFPMLRIEQIDAILAPIG